jgi:hypothetical protein
MTNAGRQMSGSASIVDDLQKVTEFFGVGNNSHLDRLSAFWRFGRNASIGRKRKTRQTPLVTNDQATSLFQQAVASKRSTAFER